MKINKLARYSLCSLALTLCLAPGDGFAKDSTSTGNSLSITQNGAEDIVVVGPQGAGNTSIIAQSENVTASVVQNTATTSQIAPDTTIDGQTVNVEISAP